LNALEQLREQVQAARYDWDRAGPSTEARVATITLTVELPEGAPLTPSLFRVASGRVNSREIFGVPPGHLWLRSVASRREPIRPGRTLTSDVTVLGQPQMTLFLGPCRCIVTYSIEYRSERWVQGRPRYFVGMDYAAFLGPDPEVIVG
jgi:hypothetical protein